ncbi:MAG: hypothetical protein ACRCZ0_07725 [Cetobacterium sp.]
MFNSLLYYQQQCYQQHKRKNNHELVKIRPDKSQLILCLDDIYSPPDQRCILLNDDIAYPNEVKHLEIHCDDSTYDSLDRFNPHSDMFINLTSFHNLTYLHLCEVSLDTKYWIEFSQNSKCLKELYLEGKHDSLDYFKFSEEALEALLRIPTLEKVKMAMLKTDFFPKGPSSIKELDTDYWLNDVDGYYETELSDNFNKSFTNNLGTHINLEKLNMTFNTALRKESLKLVIKNCKNLQYVNSIDVDIDTLISLLKLPNMKSISGQVIYDKDDVEKISDIEENFPNMEYLELLYWVPIGLTSHCKTARCIGGAFRVDRIIEPSKLSSLIKMKCPNLKNYKFEEIENSDNLLN